MANLSVKHINVCGLGQTLVPAEPRIKGGILTKVSEL